jgi:hypothetical protein
VYPTVTIQPATTAMGVGQQVSFKALLSEANGNTWLGTNVTWTSSDAAVVAITTTDWGNASGDIGVVTAKSVGKATITGTTESATIGTLTITVSGTAPPPPVPSTAPSSGGGHEPAGMYTQINTGPITSTSVVSVFSPSTRTSAGEWSGNLTVVPGATGLRVTYPTDVEGGNSPVRFGHTIASPGTGWYYQRMLIRFSSNFSFSGNSDVKLCEPQTEQFGNVSGAFENDNIDVHGPSGSAFLFVGLQGPDSHFANLTEEPANMSAANLQTGTWHTMEVLFTPESSPGAGNGTYTGWVDGTEIAHYTSVQWLAAGNVAGWPYLMFDPTYGGGTNSPAATMYWDFDQLFVSTK